MVSCFRSNVQGGKGTGRGRRVKTNQPISIADAACGTSHGLGRGRASLGLSQSHRIEPDMDATMDCHPGVTFIAFTLFASRVLPVWVQPIATGTTPNNQTAGDKRSGETETDRVRRPSGTILPHR